jgi:hypothetical protein
VVVRRSDRPRRAQLRPRSSWRFGTGRADRRTGHFSPGHAGRPVEPWRTTDADCRRGRNRTCRYTPKRKRTCGNRPTATESATRDLPLAIPPSDVRIAVALRHVRPPRRRPSPSAAIPTSHTTATSGEFSSNEQQRQPGLRFACYWQPGTVPSKFRPDGRMLAGRGAS